MPSDSEPNFELRALVAVALSLAVMIGWQMAFAPESPPSGPGVEAAGPAGTEAGEAGETGETAAAEGSRESERAARKKAEGERDRSAGPPPTGEPPEEATDTPAGGVAGARAEAEAPVDVGEPVGADAEERVVVETGRYRITLTNRGARLESVILKDYTGSEGRPLEMVVRAFAAAGHLPLALLTPDRPGAATSANRALYEMRVEGGRRSGRTVEAGAEPVTVTWQWADGAGAAVEKMLVIPPDAYLLDLALDVVLPDAGATYVSVGPGLVEGADAGTAGLYLVRGALYRSTEDLEHWADDDLEEAQRMEMGLRWGGVESNYFAALLVGGDRPARIYMDSLLEVEEGEGEDDAGEGGDAAATAPDRGARQGDGDAAVGRGGVDEPVEAAASPASGARFGLAVPPAGLEVPLYLGPKDYDVLAAQGHGLEEAVDFGIFGFLAYPLLVGLKWIYAYVGNYGVAIILLTVLIRVLFLPLTHTSMKSMRKMQELQPEMKAIRERYKGVKDLEKRQEMNEEIMGLYKEHGVSPLGGCLPMLLQMPVLFAFYACLSVAIEIRHAPFMLWIQDLSMYDPYYVLPVLMGVSMYAQQKMSPTSADPTQARIFRLMPIMFTFFFLSLPSGLVLYWLVNNLLGVGQQAVITRQMNPPEDESSSGGPEKKKKKGRRKKRKK